MVSGCVGGCGNFGELVFGLDLKRSIWWMNMRAIALFRDGGYSLSWAVLNWRELSCEIPMLNCSSVLVGLWHVFCRL